MGYNARNDEIRDNVTRRHREREAPGCNDYGRPRIIALAASVSLKGLSLHYIVSGGENSLKRSVGE
jgi:hypothetical protein